MSGICGVIVAAVTPRRQASEPDLGATFEVLDYLGASGASGIALMGSTGEFLHFDLAERIRLVSLSVKRSRLPVVAGVAHSTLDGALALGRAAVQAGAAALLLMPPYYFRYSQEEVREFYLHFASELEGYAPLFLYRIPCFTNDISCDVALDLLATGQFAGIKDSSGIRGDFDRLNAAPTRRRFTLLVGNDSIFAEARSKGADGVVSGVGCAAPELIVALDRAIGDGRAEAAARLDARLKEFIARADALPAPIAIREAVAVRGLKVGPHAAPLGPESARRCAEFREWFKNWLPDVKKECSNA